MYSESLLDSRERIVDHQHTIMLFRAVAVHTILALGAPRLRMSAQDGMSTTLEVCTTNLFDSLGVDAGCEGNAGAICELHEQLVLPNIPAIYSSSLPVAERTAAIQELSRSLDTLEEAATGPMLTGPKAGLADAALFPSFALLDRTLPQQYEPRAGSEFLASTPPMRPQCDCSRAPLPI